MYSETLFQKLITNKYKQSLGLLHISDHCQATCVGRERALILVVRFLLLAVAQQEAVIA